MSQNKQKRQLPCAWLLSCLLTLVFSTAAFADISLPRIFSDHMVLQQKSQVKIWGKAEANQEVEINFNQQTVSATANANGDWSGLIQTPAAGGPFQVEVKSKNGQTKVVLNDVMVGEVWICAGQNNMEFAVSNSLNAEAETEKAKNFSSLRLFTVGHHAAAEPVSEVAKADGWNVCNPDSIAEFSAVAYFFGRNLSENLDIPIGLVLCSRNATQCEAWTSKTTLQGQAELQPLLKYWEENDDPTNENRPSNLFNGMIAPLKGVKFRGFIWYQGESNLGRGHQYATLLPSLIQDWRIALENRDAPFYFVQLAPHRYDQQAQEDLPEIWDAQLRTHKNMPNTGMVVTTDIGDIKDMQPRNKQEVGRRLALWAFAGVYVNELKEKNIQVPSAYSGPIFKSMEKVESSNVIRIAFDHVADGLECRDGEELTNFTICGADKKFVAAQAKIEDGTILVSSAEIDEPIAVRFAWDDAAQPNLFNSSGLPASPFRTDDFKLLSEEVDF